jgi:hypothetical protein
MPPDADTPQVRKLCHRTHPQPESDGTVTPVRRITYHFAVMPVSGPRTPGGNNHERSAHERATESLAAAYLATARSSLESVLTEVPQGRDYHLHSGVTQTDAQ